jgi:hypothetical protein
MSDKHFRAVPGEQGEFIEMEMASASGIAGFTPRANKQITFLRADGMHRKDASKTRKAAETASGVGGFIQHGKVTFGAGIVSTAVTFPIAYSAAPNVHVSIEGGALVQSGSTQTVTTTGFTFRRSTGAGTVTGHWQAIGAG